MPHGKGEDLGFTALQDLQQSVFSPSTTGTVPASSALKNVEDTLQEETETAPQYPLSYKPM
jgi:hypothetical protein